ncbi:hypothetical protein PENANT_c111G06164 [Penicillium antarcticum]|uniref:Uncharacterized protein n=1 Tax=Penicillium antarcticum TaxID=416450 RepID=A0A1V6PK00_9EURO|nr:hypothetical protein PENANT_c111G06164 [Penicillium antarcticum]
MNRAPLERSSNIVSNSNRLVRRFFYVRIAHFGGDTIVTAVICCSSGTSVKLGTALHGTTQPVDQRAVPVMEVLRYMHAYKPFSVPKRVDEVSCGILLKYHVGYLAKRDFDADRRLAASYHPARSQPSLIQIEGYLSRHQQRLTRLSLVTDGTCPETLHRLEGVSKLCCLTAFEWEGLQHPSEVDLLRQCIRQNWSRLDHLCIGFVPSAFARALRWESLGLQQSETAVRGPTAIVDTGIENLIALPALSTLSLSKSTLTSLIYHERQLAPIDADGLFEDERDVSPSWIINLSAIVDLGQLSALALCASPSAARRCLGPMAKHSQLRVLHLRFSGLERIHRDISREISTFLHEMRKGYSRHPRSCWGSVNWNLFIDNNYDLSFDEYIDRSQIEYLDPQEAVLASSAAIAEAEDLVSFAEWAFGPDGLPALRVLAFGDFSHGDRYRGQQFLMRRNCFCECGGKGLAGLACDDTTRLPFRPANMSDPFIWDGARMVPIDPSRSLTSDMTQSLQHDTAPLASSAVDLLDLYLCLWECYTIKSASKIRLEEERRYLQNSQEWLVRENERLQQYCNHQELLLWDRRQAFLSVHQGVLGTLQNSDRQSCQISELQ